MLTEEQVEPGISKHERNPTPIETIEGQLPRPQQFTSMGADADI